MRAITRRWAWLTIASIAALSTIGCKSTKAQKRAPTVVANRPETAAYSQYLSAHANLSADQVLASLPPRRFVEQLPFDPSSAEYYPEVTAALQMTDKEKAILAKEGLVSVDHRQHFSMGSMYYAIYVRDLPVLITTDSIAHALHRSYDQTLKILEQGPFSRTFIQALDSAHEELAIGAEGISNEKLLASVRDVDLYMSVARNLLAGMGGPWVAGGSASGPDAHYVESRFGQDAKVRAILNSIASLELEKPGEKSTQIYGGKRSVDWSQFRARGHYTESEFLQRYFRLVMWLGRADLAWHLQPPDPKTGIEWDVERERRNAALFSFVLEKSGQFPSVQKVSDIVDFLVGKGDSPSVAEMHTVLPSIQANRLADFADPAVDQRLQQAVKQLASGTQQIRSQALLSDPTDSVTTPTPAIFQVFGQRFVIDSFVMSKLVFDSIVYQDKKQRRMMPLGLDVLAAMGNDEAVRLLAPELRKWNYGPNLMATRSVVESYSPATWNQNVANRWLNALRSLDDDFPEGAQVPQAMRTRAWQHKQLQTQLASWAEMRRDMILYVKQSYSGTGCSYPLGYVEPYPQFYEQIAELGRSIAGLLGAIDGIDSHPLDTLERGARSRDYMVIFWTEFANTTTMLKALAEKELAGLPFSGEEQAFLKNTIDKDARSGGPKYNGWYPKLILGEDPEKLKPVVADVHTDPESSKVLEVGVGDVTFLVVAIDNQGDKGVYVGPASSYYEFYVGANNRMTDAEWEGKVNAFATPSRPTWTASFQPQLQTPAMGRSTMAGKEPKRQAYPGK